MSYALALELFGYLGSFLILISMLMTSVVRLRVINLIGSAVFAAYAVLIHSYPTALLNACLVGVNVYHLLKLRTPADKNYEIHRLDPGEGFTDWFIRKYLDDIKRYFPEFEQEKADSAGGFAVFYDNRACGILLGKEAGESFEILLDYTMPAFRDCSVGEYLYGHLPSYGITRLSYGPGCPEHVQYMEKMGFIRQDDNTYVKKMI